MPTRRHQRHLLSALLTASSLALAATIQRADLVGSPQTLSLVWAWGLLVVAGVCGASLVPSARRDRLDLQLLALAAAMRLVSVPWIPHLSDDVYRFVWDGRLAVLGIDPFASTPATLWNAAGVPVREALADLYPHLNSPDYYSVYPPLLQAVFATAAHLAHGSLLGAVVVMKLVVVGAELVTIVLLDHLAVRFGLDRRVVWLYALNPVVVLELTANLHFEALMITGLLATVALLAARRSGLAGAALSVAVGAKLLPLLVVPVVLRRLGWRDGVRFVGVLGVLTAVPFVVMLDAVDADHLLQSLRLYVRLFAWNGGVYELVQALWWHADTGVVLAGVAAVLIVAQAALERSPTVATLPRKMLLALATWHLLATTVHPWYLVPLVALSTLSPYRFALGWSALSMLTYAGYWRAEPGQVWPLVALEHAIVWPWLALELFVHGSGDLDGWLRRQPLVRRLMTASLPARVAIKLDRVLPHLHPGDRILDVGTGSGALCAALRERGHDVVAMDVEDRTLVDVHPVIGDGSRLPFDDDAFDVVLLVTVLHHTPDPDALLGEAARVARRTVVVMEDVHRHPLQRWWTTLADSLATLDLARHPHTNRDDAGWREAFARHGMIVRAAAMFRTLVLFEQAVYALSAPDWHDPRSTRS